MLYDLSIADRRLPWLIGSASSTLQESQPEAGPVPGDGIASKSSRSLVPYAISSLQGLATVINALPSLVKREVTAGIRQQQEEITSRMDSQREPSRPLIPAEMVSDEVARLLMSKMRMLAQEEHFRLGRLH